MRVRKTVGELVLDLSDYGGVQGGSPVVPRDILRLNPHLAQILIAVGGPGNVCQ